MYSHTLGGFYLARYSDSPVGAFDEVRHNPLLPLPALVLVSSAFNLHCCQLINAVDSTACGAERPHLGLSGFMRLGCTCICERQVSFP